MSPSSMLEEEEEEELSVDLFKFEIDGGGRRSFGDDFFDFESLVLESELDSDIVLTLVFGGWLDELTDRGG